MLETSLSNCLHNICVQINSLSTSFHFSSATSKETMASLNVFFSPMVTPQRRVVRSAATAAKSSGGSSEEKGILDFILGSLTKEDQFYETDPILQKVEGKSSGGATATTTTTNGRKNSVAVPPPKKKDGGFGLGNFFPKK